MPFFQSYQNSLFKKLLLGFLFVGFFPFLVLYLYTIILAEERLVDKTIAEQNIQAKIIINSINAYFISLQKEIRFISKLDLMDDIIADDLDKRISHVLLQKKEDINQKVELYVTNKEGSIIASSNKNIFNKKLLMTSRNIYISSKIYASFDKKKYLGTLILEYNLENLTRFFRHQFGVHNAIVDKFSRIISGKQLPFSITIKNDRESYIDSEHLIVYKKLSAPLNDFYFVYAIDKVLALDFLHQFLLFMLYILPIIMLIIIIIAIYSSKSITKPIQKLTKNTEEITDTKDYSKTIFIDSQDEIGRLSYAFNELLHTTNKALKALEVENSLRLERFVKLIEIFNTIITTKSQKECINTSLKEIQKLSDTKQLEFTKNAATKAQSIPIFVSDFSKNEKIFFGAISLDMQQFNDRNEEKFYYSIASMISLQLDRIRLIDKTMSESNAKSAFISNMSHELRTPLNAILGYTQYLIAYENINEDQQDIVSKIENSAEYLLEMINGILDIAKIEAGKMEVHLLHVDIKDVVENIIAMLYPLAEQKNITIHFKESDIQDKDIITDKKLLQQIIINLLSNAIKFTEQGEIILWIEQQNRKLSLHIKDSGIGIEKNNLEKLFSEFTQVENVMQKKHKGTGLGLSLSKKLAHLLGGDIVLKSEGLEKGSEAIFSLPFESPLQNNSKFS